MLYPKIFVSTILFGCLVCIQQPAQAGNTVQKKTTSAATPVPGTVKTNQSAADLAGTSEVNLSTSQPSQVTLPEQTGIALRRSDLDFVRLEPALSPSDLSMVDEDPGLQILLESVDNRRP